MSHPADELRKYLILPSQTGSEMENSSPTVTSSLDAESATTSLSNWLKTKDNVSMKIDQPEDPSLHSSTVGHDEMAQNGIFRVDDFLAAYKDQLEARRTKGEAPPQSQTQTAKMAQIPPGMTPTPLGTRSSEHIMALNNRYQALGIAQPQFEFEGRSELGWTVRVAFPGLEDIEVLQNIPSQGRFSSKGEAKEALSKVALDLLNKLEAEGSLQASSRYKRLDSSTNGIQPNQPPTEVTENYIGQLLEFQRACHGPQPSYANYQQGTRFACLVHLDGIDASPFGSLSSLYSTKKAAQQAAASKAVQYFKDQGIWPETVSSVGGIRKRKATIQPSLPPSSSSPTSSTPLPPAADSSFASRVTTLSTRLSLGPPSYAFTPNPSAPEFLSAACFFNQTGLSHLRGPLGEIDRAFGKKQAKEACAQRVLDILLDEEKARIERAKRMVREIELERGGKQFPRKDLEQGGNQGDDEEGDEFEDALES